MAMRRNIRRLADDRALTIRELARRAGMTEVGLHCILSGRRNGTLLTALAIADALEVSLAELLGEA